jgi:hypothetical protein
MGAEPSFDYSHRGGRASTQGLAVLLEPGEELIVRGQVQAGWGRRTPLGELVVTDRRLLVLTQRLFGRNHTVEIERERVLAVSPPDADGFVDVRYLTPDDRQAVVRLAPLRFAATDLHRALADATP